MMAGRESAHEAAAQSIPVLTIDGPSGAGKGTVAALVAARQGWHVLDSGALYRAAGLALKKQGIDSTDEAAVARCATGMRVQFLPANGGSLTRVLLNGEDISAALRTEEAGALASAIAGQAGLRRALLDKQRELRRAPGLVADGRDMGTVVFPDASCKVFLTATARARAQRRFLQLQESGITVNIQTLVSQIEERDERDRTRALAPLVPATDAVVIDTTAMSIEESVQSVLSLLRGA